MTPIVIRLAAGQKFTDSTPVAQPIGDVIAMTRVTSDQALSNPKVALGIWECTPGIWRRQVMQAEYSYIIDGKGVFTPDQGDAIEFEGGDAIYFAPGTTGVWDIEETVTKHYFIVG